MTCEIKLAYEIERGREACSCKKNAFFHVVIGFWLNVIIRKIDIRRYLKVSFNSKLFNPY